MLSSQRFQQAKTVAAKKQKNSWNSRPRPKRYNKIAALHSLCQGCLGVAGKKE
jgi:hypothetical protein